VIVRKSARRYRCENTDGKCAPGHSVSICV